MEGIPMKICRTCGRNLPLSDYYAAKTCRDGYNPSCKHCLYVRNKERIKLWEKKHPDKLKQYQKKHHEKNKKPKKPKIERPGTPVPNDHVSTKMATPNEKNQQDNVEIVQGNIRITQFEVIDDCHVYTINDTHKAYCFQEFPRFFLVETIRSGGKTDKATKLAIQHYLYKGKTQ